MTADMRFCGECGASATTFAPTALASGTKKPDNLGLGVPALSRESTAELQPRLLGNSGVLIGSILGVLGLFISAAGLIMGENQLERPTIADAALYGSGTVSNGVIAVIFIGLALAITGILIFANQFAMLIPMLVILPAGGFIGLLLSGPIGSALVTALVAVVYYQLRKRRLNKSTTTLETVSAN